MEFLHIIGCGQANCHSTKCLKTYVFSVTAVRPRQHGLQCDGCSRWQHRKCETGVTQENYRSAIREHRNIEWSCSACSQQNNDNDIDNVSADFSVENSNLNPAGNATFVEQHSFNVKTSFETREPLNEQSLSEETTITPTETADSDNSSHTNEYHIIDTGTKRGKRMLVDDDGYSFTVKKQKNDHTLWRCTKRAKETNCPATIIQDGETYQKGLKEHAHPAEPGKHIAVTIEAEAKSKAHESVFEKSAPWIVEEAFRQHANTTAPEPSRPNPSHLVRAVNRIRQNLRPHDPVDLDFQLDESFLEQIAPNFVRHDIEVGDRRYIVMYTDRQLELLAKAKTWYMDGTFKVVNKPWMQLFSIHAFVASDDNTKQIPLVFCFMSGKRKDDYYAVLRAVDRRLPERIELKKVVVDFEMGMWQAINKRFEGIPIQGCAFHWSEAVFRKIQELQTDYNSRDESYTFLRKVMALPFLPPEHIPHRFRKLDERVESPVIQRLMDYVYNTWINSNIFKIECWSVFMCSVCTNNDTEGWHHRLNTRVNSCGSVPFYLLVVELYKESMDIPLLTKLISENKLQRRQRKNLLKMQGQLFKLWDDYN